MIALVVDDDRVLADLIAFTLRREGFQVIQAHDGEAALRRWEADRPDVLILDVNLPKLDGFAVCRAIRAQDNTPILLLTVREEEDDIVHGLGLGADDYVLKPFSPRQLVARVQAVLRRAGSQSTPAIRQVGALSLDSSRREAQLADGEAIALTPLENRLLDYLMLNANHILTAEDIINHVWGAEGGDRDALRQLVRRLRAKIEPDPANPIYIETISGLGYGLIAKN
ncbi:MAG: response regulator transcription factor [Anaerolinea sp.]|nr:response regulator transcription factor [Anaerolinea sp.]